MANPALQWKRGAGWLVFSGGHTSSSPIRAKVLGRAKPNGHVVYISFAPDEGDDILDDMEDLGAPAGYILDVAGRSNEAIMDDFKEASIVVLESSEELEPMLQGLSQVVIDGIESAFMNGATILIEGIASNLFGRWIMTDSGDRVDGLNWVENGFLEPNIGGAEESYAVQAILRDVPQAIAISISQGSALALGFDGQLEVWGQQQVTITLGTGYQT